MSDLTQFFCNEEDSIQNNKNDKCNNIFDLFDKLESTNEALLFDREAKDINLEKVKFALNLAIDTFDETIEKLLDLKDEVCLIEDIVNDLLIEN